jgi:hypothetical protein
MMKIKLTDLRAYYINLHSDKAKNRHTKKLLESLGFVHLNRSPGFLEDNYIIGSGSAYQNVLISRCEKGDPFILFEDDIELTHFDHIIDVPDDADAIYLGVSNMLATHAIVYLNMDYVKSAAKAAQKYLDQGLPHDLGIAENMKNWKVYALDKPMFIQSPKFRYYTDTAISKLPNTTQVKENKINKWFKLNRG